MYPASTLTSWADETWPAPEPDQILPGLWQGGTPDDEVIGHAAPDGHYAGIRGWAPKYPFDLVVTLYADAQPAPWGVREYRYGFPDGPLAEPDAQQAIGLARLAHDVWSTGDRVLIRCQAGVNRSGLVSALVLMLAGYPANEAIDLLRLRRGSMVLCNEGFETWLRSHATRLLASDRGAAA